MITTGVNGYLADYQDVNSLAKYIDIAINHINHSDNMIKEGHLTVEQYSSDKVYEEFISSIS